MRNPFKEIFAKKKTIDGGFLGETIEIDIPEKMYIRELAIYSAVSIIANAISQCEILVYKDGEKVRDNDWYSLNIRPNPNETASHFWHKVVEKMLTADPEKGAFVFTNGGNLYCADEYQIKEKRPFRQTGNLYDGVIVDEFVMNRNFVGREVIIFKLEENQANQMVRNMYSDLSDLISSAAAKYKSANKQRWKYKINGRETADKEFQKKWQKQYKDAVRKYVNGDAQVYIEYDDGTLDPVETENRNTVNAEDNIKLINEVFEIVARAFHIPPGIMTAGNYNIKDVMNQFLTFAVDPIADMIGKTLTASYYDSEKFSKGCKFRVDTSKIRHFDIFGMASDVDKLISSGFASVNEVRRAADWDVAGDPDDPENWLNEHILTKNYLIGGKEREETKNV